MNKKIFKVLGILCIFMALSLSLYNSYLSQKAQGLSQEVVRTLKSTESLAEDLKGEESDLTLPLKEIDGVDFIGRLLIPSLDKDLPVAADYDEEILANYPVRYRGQTYKDPLVIMAHNYRSHFGGLRNLSLGDQIIFIDALGRKIYYELEIIEVVDGNDLEYMVNTDYDLTLFTCTLERSTRFTLRAKKVDKH